MRHKVSVIGAGNVGATCAQRIAGRGYADVVMVDIVEGLPQGKALDMMESSPILDTDCVITGSNDYQATSGSDVVIITSGLARKPGMSRDELVLANAEIVAGVTRNVTACSPDCVIIVATNPVDAMTHLALEVSGFPASRVFGLSGLLDGARLRSFIAAELGVSVTDVSACVMGEHGKNMVVVPRLCTAHGVPITELLSGEAIGRLVRRTVNGGAEIVELLKTGSAFYAPSAALARMAEAVILDKKQVLYCAAGLQGEYGIKDTVIGVPVKLGKGGIEQVVTLPLDDEEKAQLAASAEAVSGLVRLMKEGRQD